MDTADNEYIDNTEPGLKQLFHTIIYSANSA